MEEADIRAPLYYVLGRDSDLEAALSVFAITPCSTGIVSRHSDKTLIEPFIDEVLKADQSACGEIAAHLARTTGFPILIVGEGSQMTAVYSDGAEEEICLSKPTLTS